MVPFSRQKTGFGVNPIKLIMSITVKTLMTTL